jgi:hypothetical protein
MQITANYTLYGSSQINGSPMQQSKPIEAGISTTGEDIGKAFNAAMGGVTLSDIADIRAQIQQILQQMRRSPSGS